MSHRLPYGRPLTRSSLARPSTVVAPDLLGRVLLRVLPDGTRLAGRIVEVEAYAEGDPASHSFRGLTPRTRVMFGPPGHLYVYLSYGMHLCCNVVTGAAGEGSAVLLRALEPLEGADAMAEHRGVSEPGLLCSGPGRLTQAMAIERSHDGADLIRGPELRLLEGIPVPRTRIERTTRVGVSVGVERRWRYLERGSAFVSRGRPSVAAPPATEVRGSRGS